MLVGGTARGPVYTFMVQPAELLRRGGEGGGEKDGANPEDDGADCGGVCGGVRGCFLSHDFNKIRLLLAFRQYCHQPT